MLVNSRLSLSLSLSLSDSLLETESPNQYAFEVLEDGYAKDSSDVF